MPTVTLVLLFAVCLLASVLVSGVATLRNYIILSSRSWL